MVERGSAYEMHSIVNVSMVAVLIQKQGMDTVLELVAKAFSKTLLDGSFENWPLWRMYFPHASALVRKITADNVDTVVICFRMSCYLHLVRRYNEAEDLARRSNRIYADFLGQKHPDTLRSKTNLLSTYCEQGRWKEAEELELKVMETSKRALSQDHLDTLISMANLASTYRNQGRWKEAEELLVEAIETRKVFGQEHPDTLLSLANLAYTRKPQGRVAEAVTILTQAVNTFAGLFDNDHPHSRDWAFTLKTWKGETSGDLGGVS